MVKYSQIDLPLSWACGARTDDAVRLEQTRLDVWTSRNTARRRSRRADDHKLAACKTLGKCVLRSSRVA